MTEPTQADKTTLDRACTEWCMGEPSIAYQIIADYRIQARRDALEEALAAVDVIESQFDEHSHAPENCAFYDAIGAVEEAIRNLARFPTAPDAGKSES